MLVPFAWLLSLKDISFVIKISKYAMGCLCIYFILICVVMGDNVHNGNLANHDVKLWGGSLDEWLNALSIIFFSSRMFPGKEYSFSFEIKSGDAESIFLLSLEL